MKKLLKKIGRSWKENRVLFVLTIILFICIILIISVVINYFLGSNKDKFGDRLDGIKKVEITDKKQKELENKIAEDESISKCSINQRGKTIYVTITFNSGISMDDAKGKAQATLELFSEKELKFYDIGYTLIQKPVESTDGNEGSPGFTTMGTHNINGTGLSWINNTPVSTENGE